MVTKSIYFIFLPFLLSLKGCSSEEFPFDKADLTYRNQFVFDNQFNMNGVFQRQNENNTFVLYFWENGYMYHGGSSNYSYNDTQCYQILERTREIPYAWGCFIVEDNLLKVQTYNSIKNISKFEVEERWFTIQNDTILHYFKRIFKGDHFPKNEIYILKPCENKPDSRNVLM
jgi:hypothetical protein